MAYLSEERLREMGFKSLGRNVRISDKASIYDAHEMELGDHCRIDDFCVVSGKVKTGRNVHFAIFSNVAGGSEGIIFEDFAGLAYSCHVFSQSDNYSGASLTNPTTPDLYKTEFKAPVVIGRHAIVGTGSLVLPGVTLGEGTAVGALSMVTQDTDPWSLYMGVPARKIQRRKQDLLELERRYLSSEQA